MAVVSCFGPSTIDVFKKFYHRSETYLPAVHLQDYDLQAAESDEVSRIAQRLISQDNIRQTLSAPIDYSLEGFQNKNRLLESRGFRLLSIKAVIKEGKTQELHPFYNVIEHDDLQGWIIKAGGDRVANSVTYILNDRNEILTADPTGGLLRVPMRERLATYAEEKGIEVVLPRKRLVSYLGSYGEANLTRKYCIISEKLDILSEEETVARLKEMTPEAQAKIAAAMCTLIESGIVDATFSNFRLTKEDRLCLIDTEPFGVLSSDSVASMPHSVEKCARIGLYNFKGYCSKKELGIFTPIVERAYQKSQEPTILKVMVILSIACPLIPMALIIAAFFKSLAIGIYGGYVIGRLSAVAGNPDAADADAPDANMRLRKWVGYIEGIPFQGKALIQGLA